MTDLSPAAQTVLDTMHRSYDHEPTRRALAAGVLRAAADQVVPADQSTDRRNGILRTNDCLWDDGTAAICRRGLLAIAAELDPTS